MELKSLNCPNCGANLDVENGLDTFYCKYCGYKIVIDGQSDAAYDAKVKIKDMEHKERLEDKKNEQEKYRIMGVEGVTLDEIDARLEELQKELLNVANAKENYDSIADEIYRLREAKQNAQVDNAEREGKKQRISEMQQFLAEQTQDITEYDEQLVRRLIEKITVYDERVTVEFKSGTSVDVRR